MTSTLFSKATPIDDVWQAYIGTLEAGDLEGWLALWTDDGVQMPDGVSQRVGKAEIRAKTKELLDNFHVAITHIDTEEFHVAGGWAYARGLYGARFTPRRGGDTATVDGKFLTIYARQPDGSWKIHRDIFNSNVSP